MEAKNVSHPLPFLRRRLLGAVSFSDISSHPRYNDGMSEATESELTAQIIEQACAAGIKRGKPYAIEFAFFGDQDQLQELRREMLAAGYSEDTSQTDQMLIFVRPVAFDLAHIEAAKAEMQALAARYGVTFDGWSVGASQQ